MKHFEKYLSTILFILIIPLCVSCEKTYTMDELKTFPDAKLVEIAGSGNLDALKLLGLRNYLLGNHYKAKYYLEELIKEMKRKGQNKDIDLILQILEFSKEDEMQQAAEKAAVMHHMLFDED